jgi:hypothetical protein
MSQGLEEGHECHADLSRCELASSSPLLEALDTEDRRMNTSRLHALYMMTLA